MQVSHFQSGRKRDGFITMIHADGFSGIVATLWVGDILMMRDRLRDGRLLHDMQHKLLIIVRQGISFVGHVSDKHCFIGRMTVEKFDHTLLLDTI